MCRVLVALLLLAGPAAAQTLLYTTPFEMGDANSNNADDLGMFQILGSTAEDADVAIQGDADCTGNNTPRAECAAGTANGNIQHDERNGTGHYSSQHALYVDVTTGELAAYTLPYNAKCSASQTCQCVSSQGCPASATMDNCTCCTGAGVGNCVGDSLGINEQQITASFNLRILSLPGSGRRRVFDFIEGDGSLGCGFSIDSTGKVEQYYNNTLLAVAPAISTWAWKTQACEDDKLNPCSAGGDCALGVCGATTCSDTDGSDCYWGPFSVTEDIGSGVVTCATSVRGSAIIAQTTPWVPLQNVTDFRIGAVGSEANAGSWAIDDFALCRGLTCLTAGYVAALGPKYATNTSATSTNLLWQASAGSDHGKLVNDFIDPEGKYSIGASQQVIAKSAGVTEELWSSAQNSAECTANNDCLTVGAGTCAGSQCPNAQTTSLVDSDVTARGLMAFVVGNTDNDAGNRSVKLYPLLCTAWDTCSTRSTAVERAVLLNTTTHLYGSGVWRTTDAGQSWTDGANLGQLGLGLKTGDPIAWSITLTAQPDATAGIDAYIDGGATTTNFGTATTLGIGRFTSVTRALLQFDLSSIPAGATITQASLTLVTDNYGGTMTGTISRVTQNAWTEAGATWNKYDGTTDWTVAGAGSDVTSVNRVAYANANASLGGSTVLVGLAPMADYAFQNVAGQKLNMLFINDVETGINMWIVRSSDHGATGDRPKLVVQYTTPTLELRAQATLLALAVDRTVPAPVNLKDHNVGVKTCTVATDCCANGGGVDGGNCLCENSVCTKDGILSVYDVGDSLDGSTRSQPCNGGSYQGTGKSKRCSVSFTLCQSDAECAGSGDTCVGACSGATYCSYDTTNYSQPPNGCNLNNEVCRVCSAKTDQNGGYGWPCSADAMCPVSGATCTGDGNGDGIKAGTCSANANIPCDISGDCNALGGTCYATATCELSCPGGRCSTSVARGCSQNTDCRPPVCPTCGASETCLSGCSVTAQTCTTDANCPAGETCDSVGQCPVLRTAWGLYVADGLKTNQQVVCARDGMTSEEFRRDQLDTVMTGQNRLCSLRSGLPGTCTCASSSDCGDAACTGGLCQGNGTGAFASCRESANCGASYLCQFRPPDYIASGFDTNSRTPGGSCPHCAGYCALGGLTISGGGPLCDWAYSGKARQRASDVGSANALCNADSTCATNFGSWSQCMGLARGYDASGKRSMLVAESLTVTTATQESKPCQGGAECALFANGIKTCAVPSAQQASLFSDTVNIRNGVCRTGKYCSNAPTTPCTGSGDCGGQPCNTPTCGAGFVWANDSCWYGCAADADCSTKTCSVPADCTSPGETCTSGKCIITGMCDGTKCAGRCTIPSSAFPCTKDADCKGGIFTTTDNNQLTNDGTCDVASSTCRCTGLQYCLSGAGGQEAEEKCPELTMQWWNARGPIVTHRDYQALVRRAWQRASATGVKPLIMPGTHMRGTGGQCFGMEDGQYTIASQLALNDPFMPYVADARQALAQSVFGTAGTHSDSIHLNDIGARAAATAWNAKLRALNVCLKDADGTPQLYCRTTAGAYASGCTLSSQCDGPGGSGSGVCSGSSCLCTTASGCPSGGDCVLRTDGSCPGVVGDTFVAEAY